MTDIPEHWFQPVARFLGPAYLRNAFTMGTEQEVGFLWDALALAPGATVLDVGCGPGRHALALARRGAQVTGVDISEDFVALARQAAEEQGLEGNTTFRHADARQLAYEGDFDAVVSLCQGAFGLPREEGEDLTIFERIVAAARPGGRVALTAFSAYFAVRHQEEGDTFDAARGVNHEVATVKGPEGEEAPFDLWTSCFTPRELHLMASAAGLTGVEVYGVSPGRYAAEPPSVDVHEFLLLARKPA